MSISESHSIILMGASGAGKSYLAYALGMEACKQFYTVKYIRLLELLSVLAVARGKGIYKKVLKQYLKVKLLILDEWMLVSLTETEARDLLENIHDSYNIEISDGSGSERSMIEVYGINGTVS